MMNASDLTREPSFSVICSFFNKFGSVLGLKPQSFSKLESILTFDEDGRIDKELIDLHVRLLRKAGMKGVAHARWESSLLKFCAMNRALMDEYFKLQTFGYAHAPIAAKLNILKALCERQFDWNLKFKEQISSCSSRELRLLPVGVDCVGEAYWYQLDSELNLRIYSEEPDDSSGATWHLRAKSRFDLFELIQKLKSGEPPKSENGSGEASEVSDSDSNEKKSVMEAVKVKEPEEEDAEETPKEVEPVPTAESADPPEPANEPFSPEEQDKEEDEAEEELKLKNVKTKKGTLIDSYQLSVGSMKKKRPLLAEGKDSSSSHAGTPSADKSGDESQDIPEELKPFIERRILPRRSARNKLEKKSEEGTNEKTEEASSSGEEAPPENDKDSETSDDSFNNQSPNTPDSEYMPLSALKRGGTGKKRRVRKKEREELMSDDDSGVEEETVKKERKLATDNSFCKKCDKSKNPEVLLLCDKCDDAWHTWCLRPQLWYVPDEDWFCPKCQHSMLIEKLDSALASLDEQLKKKFGDQKRKERQQERLKREMEFIGISLNNIIGSEDKKVNGEPEEEQEEDEEESEDSEEERARRARRVAAIMKKRQMAPVVPIALARTRRQRTQVDYTFANYDEMVEEAVEDLEETPSKKKYQGPVRPSGGAGRGKDMANILQASNDRAEESGESVQVGKPPSAILTAKSKKKQRLTDLDLDNVTESDTDEYKASEQSESEPELDDDEWIPEERQRRSTRLRGPTQSDEDFVVSGSDVSEEEERRRPRTRGKKPAPKPKKRKARKKSDSDDSEDSLVEMARKRRWESGSGTSSSEEYRPSKKKKGAKSGARYRTRGRRVNYRKIVDESSSDEEGEEVGKEASAPAAAKKDARPTGAYREKKRVIDTSDEEREEPEWKPESGSSEKGEEEEEEEVEEGEEDEEEVGASKTKDPKEKKAKKKVSRKTKAISSSSENEQEKEGEAEEEEKEQEVKVEEKEQEAKVEEKVPQVKTEEGTTPCQPTPVIQSVAQPFSATAVPSGTPPQTLPGFKDTPPPPVYPQPRVPMPPPTMAGPYGHQMYYPHPLGGFAGAPTAFATLQPMTAAFAPVMSRPYGLMPVGGFMSPAFAPQPFPTSSAAAPPSAPASSTESLSDILSHAMQDEYT